jgi:eukaryotic-like serine/threonine-protein kinase
LRPIRFPDPVAEPMSDRWQRAKELFGAALERPPAERSAYLDAACAGDAALRAEVESLLAAHDEASSFLDEPAAALGPADIAQSVLRDGQLIGRYSVRELLGAGGMGQVYLADDQRLGRSVALKLLPRALGTDPDRRRRFEQEARAASSLSHPNVCVVYEIGDAEDGRRYIAMEHVPGESLRQMIERHRVRGGRVPIDDVLDIAKQSAAGLAAAHAAGVVHRDVKPENIMVRPDGLVKVLDFGLAKLGTHNAPTFGSNASAHTEPGMVLGTVRYMSPEQARGLPVDTRTDVWSFGVVLYELLAGRPPFEGATTTDVMVSVLEREPQPLPSLAPDVPQSLQRVVERALRKERDNRFEDMEAMRRALLHVRQHDAGATDAESARAPAPDALSTAPSVPPTAPQPDAVVAGVASNPRSTRRALIAAAVLAVAIALGWGAWRARDAGRDAGVAARTEGTSPTTVPAQQSLAVLPMVNTSGDTATEYFADGMTDELTGALGKVPGLRVAARSSAFAFKGKQVEVQDVGNKLHVAHVLEGSVRRAGEKLRITAQLVSTADGLTLWSETYDGETRDVFRVQQSIATAIAGALRLALSGGKQSDAATGLAGRPARNVEAYDLYLKGRYHSNRQTESDFRASIALYQQAIARDSTYAPAWAGIAESWIFLADVWLPPHEAYPHADTAARMAVALDSTLADAHATLGLVLLAYHWKFAEAERELTRAIELNPNAANGHHFYGYLLLNDPKRLDAALAAMRRAQELDPLSPWIHADAAWVLKLFRTRAAEFLVAARRAVELDPRSAAGWSNVGGALRQAGRLPEALSAYQHADDLGMPVAPFVIDILLALGRRPEALRVLDEAKRDARRRYVGGERIAAAYAALGQTDSAFVWLEVAYRDRSANLINIRVEPEYDPLRRDPRFADMLRRVGLQ